MVTHFDLSELRRYYKDAEYVTIFNDDIVVPWSPLSLGQYLQYNELFQSNSHDLYIDEIFDLCVKEQVFIQQRPFLKAGIISTVVENIWSISGPNSAEMLQEDIDEARMHIMNSGIVYEMMNVITLAYPYTFKQVQNMSYKEMIRTFAAAEKKLLDSGMLKEPMSIQTSNQNQEIQTSVQKIDPKKIWEARNTSPGQKQGKWWNKSPVLEAKAKHGINLEEERAEVMVSMSGHERDEVGMLVRQKAMLDDFALIYPELAKAALEKKETE